MIKYLIKFTSAREHAESLLGGKLFMRPASYYCKLEEQGQGDLREAAIVEGYGIYKHFALPIYCMYSVEESSIKSGSVTIDEKCIKDFKCENGFMVLLDFKMFEQMLKKVDTKDYALIAGKVNYHKLTIEDSINLLVDDSPKNLFIKHPYFHYQNEYRIVIGKQLYKPGEPEVEHIIYSFPSSFNKFAHIIPISDLSRKDGNYVLNVGISC